MNLSDEKKRELDRSYRRARNTSIDQIRQSILYFSWTILVFFSGLASSIMNQSDWNQFAKIQIVFDFVAFVFFQLMILSLFSKMGFKSIVKRMRNRPEYFFLWISLSMMIFGLIDPFFFSILKKSYSVIYGFLVLCAGIASLFLFIHHKNNKRGNTIHEHQS